MGFEFKSTENAFNEYNTSVDRMRQAPDPRPLLGEVKRTFNTLTDSIIKDVGAAISNHKKTGQIPDKSLKERAQVIYNVVNSVYRDQDLPTELKAGLNKLIGLTKQECVRNKEEAFEKLNDPYTPMGTYVIWPSSTRSGQFGFLQKLPGVEINATNSKILNGDRLLDDMQEYLVHYCNSEEEAKSLYQKVDTGRCVVWPNKPGEYSFILKTQRSPGNVESEKIELVPPDKSIRREILTRQSQYKKQQEALAAAQKEAEARSDEYYSRKNKTIPAWMVSDEEQPLPPTDQPSPKDRA